jgi:hypothetical protein
MSRLLEKKILLHKVLVGCNLSADPLLVLGMHRSGTTLIARLLGAAGIFMGSRLSSNYEPRLIQDTNRQILDYFQAGWLDVDQVPSPEALMNGFDGLCSEVATRLTEDLPISFCGGHQIDHAGWGFKDPRTSISAGLFLRLFPNARAIFIHRNAEDVASSILKRELKIQSKHPAPLKLPSIDQRMFLVRAVRAWETYNRRALMILPYFQRHASLRYEEVVAAPRSVLPQAFSNVGISISTDAIDHAAISGDRVGGHVQYDPFMGPMREYLGRSSLPGMLGTV